MCSVITLLCDDIYVIWWFEHHNISYILSYKHVIDRVQRWLGMGTLLTFLIVHDTMWVKLSDMYIESSNGKVFHCHWQCRHWLTMREWQNPICQMSINIGPFITRTRSKYSTPYIALHKVNTVVGRKSSGLIWLFGKIHEVVYSD